MPAQSGLPSPAVVNAQDLPFHVPAGFTVETVAAGLKLPPFAFAGPNRLFVSQKAWGGWSSVMMCY
ncbi:MAG: hypothetical protein R2867_44005 [Caldilineaceae bacterium]